MQVKSAEVDSGDESAWREKARLESADLKGCALQEIPGLNPGRPTSIFQSDAEDF
jgi:hypothetical protein